MKRDSNVVPFSPRQEARPSVVSFDRRELGVILSKYGQLVAAGEWRDYALDMAADSVTFSVFRRMGEFPLYRIVKRPKDTARQGAYSILAADGRILKRGQDLAVVMRFFDRKLIRLTEDV